MAISFPPYVAPVSSVFYPHICIALILMGLVTLGFFFTLQVNSDKSLQETSGFTGQVKKVVSELVVALVASCLLGFGLLFVCLNVGIYV